MRERERERESQSLAIQWGPPTSQREERRRGTFKVVEVATKMRGEEEGRVARKKREEIQ